MKWQAKAAIMRICATLPYGDRIYRSGQKGLGRLGARPLTRLPMHALMVSWLRQAGVSVKGMKLFELGTGHIPLVPIGFFLCGAERVITVDLHRRIDWQLTRKGLEWITANRSQVWALYDGLVSESVFNERFATLVRFARKPERFLKEAGIDYLAPMNAAATGLPDDSVFCHFSVTTLEHIPLADLKEIFSEAKRILSPGGLALHFVDMSDHFQHTDHSISRINFLRYSESEWQRIAGNEFAYCNRLRSSDYVDLFQQELGFTVAQNEKDIDEEAMEHLHRRGFPLHQRFSPHTAEDICSIFMRILLRKSDTHTMHGATRVSEI